MIATKVIYFAMNMAVYSTHTFSFKFFQDHLELDVWWVGAIGAVSSVHLIGAVLWGRLADRFSDYRRTLLITSTILYGVTFSMLNIPIAFDSVYKRVAWGAGWYAASIISVSALFPIVDAHVLSVIGDGGRFGRERVWGTAGHAVATLITGLTIDRFGYVGMFANLLFSGILFIAAVLVGMRPTISHVVKDDEGKEAVVVVGATKESIHDLLSPNFIFLMFVILTCGLLRSVLSIFLPLYMQNEMGRPAALVAAVTVVRTASEAVIFLAGPWLFNKIGAIGLLVLAQVTAIARCMSYAALPTHGAWFYMSFAIELLKGVSTAAVVSGGVVMAERLAPRRAKNTAQACFSGVYNGLSGTVGGIMGGVLLFVLPRHSMRWMFFIVGCCASLALAVFIAVYTFVSRESSEEAVSNGVASNE